MARIIVNEGAGPEPWALGAARVRVGSSPDCDVQLVHPAAGGCQFVIERTATGHRVITLLGQVFLNEESCDVADLQHNDTLRVGESMVLYKNPDARLPAPAPTPSRSSATAVRPAPAAPIAAAPKVLPEPDVSEDVEALEELEGLEELEASDEEPATAQTSDPAERPEGGEVAEAEAALEQLEDLIEEEDLVQRQDWSEPPARAESADGSEGARTGVAATPSGAVRFKRPLPPGHAAPAGPPPRDPGRPPR